MARSEHNRAAYARLFSWVGIALQAFALLLILASFLVIPLWVGVVLLVIAVASFAYSWRGYRENYMMPTIIGIVVSVAWMVLVGVGFGILGWSP